MPRFVLLLFTSCVFPAAAQHPVPWHAILDQPAGWYGTTEALRIAENVLAYQGPNGG